MIVFKQKQEEWQIVFWVTAIIYLIGGLGSLILGSAETAPWARRDKPKYTEAGDKEELDALKKDEVNA